MSLTVFYNTEEPNAGINWGWRHPEKDFKDAIEKDPTHQLTTIVKYCLYNKNNSLQLDKINIVDALKEIKSTKAEVDWPEAIHDVMDKYVFYNGTGKDCLFDYHDTNYGQLEGNPRQEIYEVLLDYMLNEIDSPSKINESIHQGTLSPAEVQKKKNDFLVELSQLIQKYDPLYSILPPNDSGEILIKPIPYVDSDQIDETQFYRSLAGKYIVNQISGAIYEMPEARFILKDRHTNSWFTKKAVRKDTPFDMPKDWLDLYTKPAFKECFWVYDSLDEIEKDLY